MNEMQNTVIEIIKNHYLNENGDFDVFQHGRKVVDTIPFSEVESVIRSTESEIDLEGLLLDQWELGHHFKDIADFIEEFI